MTVETVTVDPRPDGLAIERSSVLPPGVQFSSPTAKANFVFQYDGNLVDYDENRGVRFATNTAQNDRGGDGGQSCRFQGDGNLVVYDAGGRPLFASNTSDDERGGEGGRVLLIQNDGNVVIYNGKNQPLWAINGNH